MESFFFLLYHIVWDEEFELSQGFLQQKLKGQDFSYLLSNGWFKGGMMRKTIGVFKIFNGSKEQEQYFGKQTRPKNREIPSFGIGRVRTPLFKRQASYITLVCG